MNAATTTHEITQAWRDYGDHGGLRLIVECSCGKRVADTQFKRTANSLIKKHLEGR